ncbi:phosphoribosylanthranilate isomerase [Thiomicrorhabdus sp. Milos-T2]|uniref:phosphoribosylanthranilate isomerase n=1 Tax=Thiomicrorhabdus sp. Milos-T2 TaxID=90814 RepID=UPI000493CE12|nr:phosphoribosylanthranilate isomerase [Thiomicrorhabdus sp. Milos-T2]
MPLRTRVKICGLTSVEDALTAVNLGADAIGLVFYEPSPRFVDIEQAAKIAQAIPAFVTKTALFVNPDKGYVEEVLAKVNIDLLQFHGDETAEFCEQFNRPYIKAVRMQESTDLEVLSQMFSRSSGLLLDAYVPGVPGGTGEQFNWSWIPKEFALPIILAGGLVADNVKQAIQTAQPWAVDVSGGVEASKGVKSPEKIKQFMQQVMSTVE